MKLVYFNLIINILASMILAGVFVFITSIGEFNIYMVGGTIVGFISYISLYILDEIWEIRRIILRYLKGGLKKNERRENNR